MNKIEKTIKDAINANDETSSSELASIIWYEIKSKVITAKTLKKLIAKSEGDIDLLQFLLDQELDKK